MRRILFYLSVALLAFGIGSFVVISNYQKNEKFVLVQRGEKIEDEKFAAQRQNVEQIPANKIPTIKFSCNNEAINTVWERLKKNKTFIDDVYSNVIEPRQIKDCRELFDIKPIELSDDESDEFLITGNYLLFCDSGGDCQTWIVSKKNNQYKIIFESTTGNSTTELYLHEQVEPLLTKTDKLKDLKVFIPNGWDADDVGYFKFDGNKYQLSKCFRDFNSAYVYTNDYVEKWLVVKSNECLKRNSF